MKKIKMISMAMGVLFLTMCVPPEGSDKGRGKDKAILDSLREFKCPRLMSSAAEYYRNRDWKQTVRIYKEITSLDCDEWNPVYAPPKEIYQYYAIAYEQLGKFDSSEFVLLDGLQKLPESVDLRKRLAYSYKKQGKKDKEIIEYVQAENPVGAAGAYKFESLGCNLFKSVEGSSYTVRGMPLLPLLNQLRELDIINLEAIENFEHGGNSAVIKNT